MSFLFCHRLKVLKLCYWLCVYSLLMKWKFFCSRLGWSLGYVIANVHTEVNPQVLGKNHMKEGPWLLISSSKFQLFWMMSFGWHTIFVKNINLAWHDQWRYRCAADHLVIIAYIIIIWIVRVVLLNFLLAFLHALLAPAISLVYQGVSFLTLSICCLILMRYIYIDR